MINKEKLVKNIFAYLLLVIILFVEGCFNFLTFKFEISKALTISFWVNIGFRLLLLILIKAMALLIFTDKARENNGELKTEKERNTKLIKLKDVDFPYWCEQVENRRLKIDAWKLQINKKIAKLEKRSKLKDRTIYYGNSNIEKSNNKYCIKRKQLEYLLSDEYINNNFDVIRPKKIKKIDPAVFDLPVNLNSSNNDYQLVAKTKIAITSVLLTSAFGLVLITFIRQSLEFGYSSDKILPILVGLALDLIFMLYQFATGIMDSYRIINEQEVLPYVNRNRILTKYLKSKTEQKDKIDFIFEQLKLNETNTE